MTAPAVLERDFRSACRLRSAARDALVRAVTQGRDTAEYERMYAKACALVDAVLDAR